MTCNREIDIASRQGVLCNVHGRWSKQISKLNMCDVMCCRPAVAGVLCLTIRLFERGIFHPPTSSNQQNSNAGRLACMQRSGY